MSNIHFKYLLRIISINYKYPFTFIYVEFIPYFVRPGAFDPVGDGRGKCGRLGRDLSCGKFRPFERQIRMD